MNHPMVAEMERTGYPKEYEPSIYGTDSLGYVVYTGEEILVLEDEFYLKENLISESIEILNKHGATSEVAQ